MWTVLIRAIPVCLMICYGTVAFAGYGSRSAPGTLGIYEPRPDARPTRGWYRMDLAPMSEFGASIYHLPEPAPRNRCGQHQFEVLNPWNGEERCVGAP
jgi:hypothetical protein